MVDAPLSNEDIKLFRDSTRIAAKILTTHVRNDMEKIQGHDTQSQQRRMGIALDEVALTLQSSAMERQAATLLKGNHAADPEAPSHPTLRDVGIAMGILTEYAKNAVGPAILKTSFPARDKPFILSAAMQELHDISSHLPTPRNNSIPSGEKNTGIT